MDITLGILIPFLGTTLGSLMAFFMKKQLNSKIEKLLLGFASGVMIAASIWSLIIPALEASEEQGLISWIPVAIGFIIGILFFVLVDVIMPYLENNKKVKIKSKNSAMLVLAVTLHNIPEGMAVGVIFAGVLAGNIGITITGAFSLAIGIAIQNFPEGAIISMPLKGNGMSRTKAFFYGALSGIVEPIAATITLLFTNMIVPVLPYVLSFAAGAMIYVVINELLPPIQKDDKSKIATVGFTIGFLIMMILDVTLG